MVKLFALKSASGNQKKAEDLIAWAYGKEKREDGKNTHEKADNKGATEAFIQDYLTPLDEVKNHEIWRFVNQYVKKTDENLNYELIEEKINEMEYADFLRTMYWRGIAAYVKKNAGNKCQLCGSKENLVTHHLSYGFHGDELHHLDELQCICRNCHDQIHGRNKQPEEPTPAPIQEPRRKPKTGSALSLSAILAENAPKEVKYVHKNELALAWEAVTELYKDRPRFHNAMKEANLDYVHANGKTLVTLYVQNDAIRAWIKNKIILELQEQLRKELRTKNVDLFVDVL